MAKNVFQVHNINNHVFGDPAKGTEVQTVHYSLAVTRVGGKTMSKSFSVKRYGDAQAKRLAIAEHQRQIEQVRKLADEGKTPKRGPRRQKISVATVAA